MLNLIQRWLGGAPPGWDLSPYPPFELPHPGSGAALSDAQAQQNLAHFQATLEPRQRMLREWLLAHAGPDAQALSGVEYAKALQAWARTHWPQLPAFARLPMHKPWPDAPRSGPFIVNSLLGDLGTSLGEAIRRANGRWRWGLNLDIQDLADDMATSRRVVLLAALTRPAEATSEAVLDPEASVFSAHRVPDSPDFVYLDWWATFVGDSNARRHYDF